MMLSDDFSMTSEAGERTEGPNAGAATIERYTESWPDFQIHIGEVRETGDMAVIMGHATNSCAETAPSEEIKQRLIYAVRVADGVVAEFHYANEDTPENRKKFGVEG
jgi:hypothetical protein